MSAIEGANFIQIVGYPENIVIASKGAQNDYLNFPADPMVLILNAYTDAGGAETFTHGLLTVASFSDTATSITYTGGSGVPRLQGNYYLKVEHEFLYVKADTDETAATGTLTVVRGALSSVVASHVASYSGYIQNTIKLTSANTGDVKIMYKGVPAFDGGLNMSTAEQRNWSTTNPNRVYSSEYTTPT